ncbi:MAG: Maf family protein [Kiritimatiellae bacterium]|jgi:septum formation protein|nr:Maf family protein [Kiritimatiellia bacterium]
MRRILASASPRRADLLRSAGLDFEVIPAHVDETPLRGELPIDLVVRLSQVKAAAVFDQDPDSLVLAADTVVVFNGNILGKPADANAASGMLNALSGQTHQVLTGFSLFRPDRPCHQQVCSTRVTFRRLGPDEIHTYVESGEPLDKAGAYGIQGNAAAFVKKIDGSYTNVVGLPLAEVVEALG